FYVMLSFPDLSALLKGVNSDHLEDMGDRLNFYITIYLLLFFTIVTGSKQHFGQPISCMGPAEMHADPWMQYFLDFCYVGPKYLVKDHSTVTRSLSGASGVGNAGMEFYQWVPYLLILQVIIFYMPKACWQSASHNYGNGLDMETFVKGAVKNHIEYGQKRRSKVRAMANFLTDTNKIRGILGCSRDSKLYTIMKWSCALNALGQLFFMSWFIADWNINWAYELFDHLYYEKTSTESPYFPRVAFCDVSKLEMGQAHNYTFQCVLMFNFVNEKIFLFLYIWVIFLLVVNVISAMRQTLILICPPFRIWIAQFVLPPSSVLFRSLSWTPAQSSTLIPYFIHNSLGCDGIFLLEAVSNHSGRIIAREIAAELFNILVKKRHDPGYNPSMETLPRPKILDMDEEDSPLRDEFIERRSLIPSTLDKRFSRSSPTLSAPPYHLLFTDSGKERNHK
ncbi:hypothetical protein PRIPAC_85132, partial [Pristionchus pacificus]